MEHPLRRDELKKLLRGGIFMLSMPPLLEALFQQAHQRFAAAMVRATLPVGAAAVFIVVALTLIYFSSLPVMVWVLGATIAFSFLIVILCTYHPRFARWFVHSLGFAGMLGVLAMHVAVSVIAAPPLATAAQFGVAYITLAIFSMTNLPVRTASAWVLASLVLVVILAKMAILRVDFSLFLYYAVSPAVIGVALGIVQELRERRLFVQEQLLALENIELDALTRKLDALSRRDVLTGLYNRRYFNEVLQEEWNRCMRNGEPLSLLYMDVDHFKQYNDHYGHQDGDQCLVKVAAALANAAMRSGDTVARYGGEEFVALFPQTDMSSATQMAEKILADVDALAIPHAYSIAASSVTLSIGVASLVPDRQHSADLLLQQADKALYRAKAGGRHRVAA